MSWSSFWDGHCRRALRLSLVALCLAEFAGRAAQVARMAGDPSHYPPAHSIAASLTGAGWMAWVLYALIAVGLVLVGTDRAPLSGAALSLVLMSVMSYWRTELFGAPSRNSFFPGAALLGWSLGQLWARESGAGDQGARERMGEAGAMACIAAAYVGSALSKLLNGGGLGWASAAQVRALVLAQEPVAEWAWLDAYREAILSHEGLAQALSMGTLAIEGGAFVLLFGARARLVWTLAILGLHTNIILLCTMPYVEPMFFLVCFALPWPQLLRWKAEPEPELPAGIPARVRWALVGLVVFAVVVAPFGWRA